MIMLRGLNMYGLGAVENDTWPSTGALDTETESLRLQIVQLGRSLFNSIVVPSEDFQNAWNTFVADFGQWADSAYFWNPTRRDELLEKRARFNQLLAQFQAIGVGGSVAGTVDHRTEESPITQIGGLLTKVAWIAGGAAALYVGFTVAKAMKVIR